MLLQTFPPSLSFGCLGRGSEHPFLEVTKQDRLLGLVLNKVGFKSLLDHLTAGTWWWWGL